MFKCVEFQIVGLRFIYIALVNVSMCQMYCQHGIEHSTAAAAEAATVTTKMASYTLVVCWEEINKKTDIPTPLCGL